MGGEDSKPEAQAPQNTQLPEGVDPNDENHFYLEELQKMSLNGRKEVFYYWIDPRVYNAENQKYFNQFLQHFHIDSFTSTEGLKTELMEIQNENLVTFDLESLNHDIDNGMYFDSSIPQNR